MKLSHCLLIVSAALAACQSREVTPPAPLGPLPTASQLAWHRMEMNAFVHFSINTFTDKEWGYGDEQPSLFQPTAFDAKQWAAVFKDTGFKGVILTCKHHDGFCLWPSQHTTHSVKNSPWQNGRGDVVRALADACRDAGLEFGIYVSPWDRNQANYGTPAYVDYYRDQLTELFQKYGPMFEMWFDGANGGDGFYGGAREKRKIDGASYYDWPATLDLVRSFNPHVIFFSDAGPGVRWVGNEKGIAGETNWNTITPDTLFAGKAGIEQLLSTGHEGGTHWIPAETDVSIRPGWFYHAREDSLVKTPEQLFNLYLTSVGRGSTLLLNVPPDRRGLIHENDVAALRGFRALLNERFAHDLAREATIRADQHRGNAVEFSPGQLIDGNPDTYWATNDEVISASVELQWPAEKTIRYVHLQEAIALGQRVRSWQVEIFKNGTWVPLATATTVGYKRILDVGNQTTTRLRISITDARASLALAELSVY
jgi:alpha-L-fucosidase